MKIIFETFKKSIYNLTFYKEVAETPFSEALRYYVKITLVFSLILTIFFGAISIPFGISFVKNRAPVLVKEYYPKDLSVHIEKGIALANVEMPYLVPLKGNAINATSSMQNLMVINTNEDFSKNKFVEYKTYSLLTRTDLVTQDSNGAITITPLPSRSTITISQDQLFSWIGNIQKYTWAIVVAIVVGTFTVIFCGYLMYLVPLVLFALIPKFIAYIKKSPISYSSAYKMSLYAIIPALALKALLGMLGVFFLPPYFTLLVFLLVISLNMREMKEPTLFESN